MRIAGRGRLGMSAETLRRPPAEAEAEYYAHQQAGQHAGPTQRGVHETRDASQRNTFHEVGVDVLFSLISRSSHIVWTHEMSTYSATKMDVQVQKLMEKARRVSFGVRPSSPRFRTLTRPANRRWTRCGQVRFARRRQLDRRPAAVHGQRRAVDAAGVVAG
jgi:hypothetical protein